MLTAFPDEREMLRAFPDEREMLRAFPDEHEMLLKVEGGSFSTLMFYRIGKTLMISRT